MKIMVLNGPNMNLLGIREPEIYGKESYPSLVEALTAYAAEKGVEADCRQSNHEGVLIDWVQEAYFSGYDGLILNPGGYTHTSIALADALRAVRLPAVEVHISDTSRREEYRRISYVSEVCTETVSGEGTQGYFHAVDILLALLSGRA